MHCDKTSLSKAIQRKYSTTQDEVVGLIVRMSNYNVPIR